MSASTSELARAKQDLQDAAQAIVNCTDADVEKAYEACRTMKKLIGNVVRDPTEPKYERLKVTENSTFNKAVWSSVKGTRPFLAMAGFKQQGFEVVLVSRSAVALTTAVDVLDSALLDLQLRITGKREKAVEAAHSAHVRREQMREEAIQAAKDIDKLVDQAEPAGDIEALSALPGPAIERLLVVFRNILRSPGDEKYRRLNTGNDKVAAITSHPAAAAHLLLCGFRLEATHYVLSFGEADRDTALRHVAGGVRGLEKALLVESNRVALSFEEFTAYKHKVKKHAPAQEAPKGPLDKAKQEERWTAMALINDVQGLMEQEWLLKGAVGFEAPFRKAGIELRKQYAEGSVGLIELNALRDTWEANVHAVKVDTGKTLIHTLLPSRETEEHDADMKGR
ncbi:hypothetical protein DIPPA_18387 [Diplonema papillatum]|nr:hypothetical protein DIPPA_18387 [Diplonema papillatum]